MAHKPLVNGTDYSIIGGKPLVDGTAYKIVKGRDLVGGTGYDLWVNTPVGDFVDLMSSPGLSVHIRGRDYGSSSTVSIDSSEVSRGDYVFVFFDGEFSINRIDNTESTSGITPVYQSSVSKANLTYKETSSGTRRRYSLSNYNGSDSEAYANGATLARVNFRNSGYTTEKVDSILSSIVRADGAGRNDSTRENVALSCDAESALLIACSNSMGLFYPVNTNVFLSGEYADCYYYGGVAYVSFNGANASPVCGASIIQLG